jgi:hypothetical protein
MARRCCAFSALLVLSAVLTVRAAPEYVVADWTFEEGNVGSPVTRVVDQSGRGHDSISIFGEPKFAAGSSSAGLVALDCPAVDGGFGGGSGFNVAEAPDLVATNAFTLEAMVFPRDDAVLESERRMIVVRGIGNPGNDFLAYNPTTDRFFFGLARAPRGWGEVEAAFGRDNLFHHIAGSHENGVLKLYRDGLLVVTTNLSAIPEATPTGTVSVGARFDGRIYFNGLIERVRISNRALNPILFFNQKILKGRGAVSCRLRRYILENRRSVKKSHFRIAQQFHLESGRLPGEHQRRIDRFNFARP